MAVVPHARTLSQRGAREQTSKPSPALVKARRQCSRRAPPPTNTEWLDGRLALDAKHFVKTGADADGVALAFPCATTKPRLFAIGDVRSGSMKRVASGVGEGSVVIQAVHQVLNPGLA